MFTKIICFDTAEADVIRWINELERFSVGGHVSVTINKKTAPRYHLIVVCKNANVGPCLDEIMRLTKESNLSVLRVRVE